MHSAQMTASGRIIDAGSDCRHAEKSQSQHEASERRRSVAPFCELGSYHGTLLLRIVGKAANRRLGFPASVLLSIFCSVLLLFLF
jgi:hypothetical protein